MHDIHKIEKLVNLKQKGTKKLQKNSCFDQFFPNVLTRDWASVRDRIIFPRIGIQYVKKKEQTFSIKIDYELKKNSKKLQKKTCFDHFYPNVLTRGRATVRDRKTCIHGIGTERESLKL